MVNESKKALTKEQKAIIDTLFQMSYDENTTPKAFGKKLDEAKKAGLTMADLNREEIMNEYTPLISALIFQRNTELLDEVLKRGGNLNKPDIMDDMPFSHARDIDTMKFLLKKGANINSTCSEGYTALAYAVQDGNKEVYDFLIKNKADIKTVTNDGQTLMHKAVLGNNPEIVKDLVKRGLSLNAKDKDGNTPLDYAKTIEFVEPEMQKLLIQLGAKPGKTRHGSGKGLATLEANSSRLDANTNDTDNYYLTRNQGIVM